MLKHMPAKPENATVLLDVLEAQTRAMSKILLAREMDKDSNAGFDTYAAEASVVEALRPLLTALTPEEKILNRFIVAGSDKAMRTLFDVHGAEPYIKLLERHPPRTISLGEPIKRANLSLLKAMHEAGFDMHFYADKMLPQAVRHRNPDYLSFVRNDVGCKWRILDCATASSVLEDPWPEILAELEHELRDIFSEHDNITRRSMIGSVQAFMSRNLRLREIAISLHLEPRLGHIVKDERFEVPSPSLRKLLDMSCTNHGRLALAAMEPSLGDIIARPRSAAFYGLTEADLKKEKQ
jgi:hypothetical protein